MSTTERVLVIFQRPNRAPTDCELDERLRMLDQLRDADVAIAVEPGCKRAWLVKDRNSDDRGTRVTVSGQPYIEVTDEMVERGAQFYDGDFWSMEYRRQFAREFLEAALNP